MRHINNLANLRAPSETEQKLISDFFRIYYKKQIRFRNRMGTFLLIFGIILICGCFTTGFMAAILGTLSLIGAINCLHGKNALKQKISLFENGTFQVADGSVEQITVHPDKPGVSKVRFISQDKQTLDNWFEVQQRDLHIGTHLLLVYADNASLKHDICWAFTPFMLTEEGMQKNI